MVFVFIVVSGPSKRYYVAAEIHNKRNGPIVVKWIQGRNAKQLDIESNSSRVLDAVIQETVTPEALRLTAFDKENNKMINILGRRFFEIIPRLNRTLERITMREYSILVIESSYRYIGISQCA